MVADALATIAIVEGERAQLSKLLTNYLKTMLLAETLVLGDNLDTDKVQASYDNGVLRLSIPVAEQAKPRKISINSTAPKAAVNA